MGWSGEAGEAAYLAGEQSRGLIISRSAESVSIIALGSELLPRLLLVTHLTAPQVGPVTAVPVLLASLVAGTVGMQVHQSGLFSPTTLRLLCVSP